MRLHFRKLGSGPPLIILHGLYGSGDNWYSIGHALRQFFTVYLIDQRNHGLSPHDSLLNYDVMTTDLSEFFSDHSIEKASVLGHSMGGKIAMNFAIREPDKVEKLIVIDIALRSYYQSPQLKFHKKIIEALNSLDISTTRSRSEIDAQLALIIAQPAVRQFLLKNLKRRENEDFYWSINLEALGENIAELMYEVDTRHSYFKNPVLIVSGINSGYIKADDRRYFHHVFPRVRIEEFDTGHWVHAEQPEKLIKLLLEFLLASE
jgi:esterase